MMGVKVVDIENRGDNRGDFFFLPNEALEFIRQVAEMHMGEINPSCVRGNHWHLSSREILVVLHKSEWSLYSDSGTSTPIREQRFLGNGSKVLLIEPGCAHTVVNSGTETLVVIELSPERFDPTQAMRRILYSTELA